MVRETEVKAATFCVVAFVLGLCCALMLGCKTSAKVEGGAEIIELKPLELQELTFPVHDYSKICQACCSASKKIEQFLSLWPAG